MSERITTSIDGRRLDANQIEENFNDIHPLLNKTQAMVESSRCLYCFDAPCIKACPTSIDIPKFIHQIRTDNINGSAKTILTANIMGGTCARVCPTEVLCEGSCVMNKTGEKPIAIGHLQRYAVDNYLESAKVHPFQRAASSGKSVAVIGSGPAGLACAHRLAMLGHKVRVFEARPKAGGLNEYGLAAYKMVNEFARKEVEFVLGIGGIDIEYGKILGKNLEFESLRRDFDAVFISVGLTDVRSLKIPGEQLGQVRDAIEFIDEIRQSTNKSEIQTGNDVVVIGGGNTAIDAAVQAKRLGAKRVTMVYRRGTQQMPATEWEQNLAKTNDVHVIYWSKPVEILSKQGDSVQSVRFESTRLEADALVGIGEYFEIPADLVLKAIGQVLNSRVPGELKTSGGKITVDGNYQCSIPEVFAGGDCTDSAEDLTVQAVDDGAKAAAAIDTFLNKGRK